MPPKSDRLLEATEYDKLQTMLYPSEPEEVTELFSTIIYKCRQNINRFGLSSSDVRAILDRFDALEKELKIRTEAAANTSINTDRG